MAVELYFVIDENRNICFGSNGDTERDAVDAWLNHWTGQRAVWKYWVDRGFTVKILGVQQIKINEQGE